MNKPKIISLFLASMITYIVWGQTQNPCSSEQAHQFDFWIGDWNVYKYGTDTLVGHNVISRIAGDCALLENWTGGGSIGSSINKYNFRKEKWQQMWVDNSGSTLMIEGEYKEGKMIMENVQISRTGIPVMNRITWFNNADGTVRQFWQFSNDEGKTWQVAFDGLYRKANP